MILDIHENEERANLVVNGLLPIFWSFNSTALELKKVILAIDDNEHDVRTMRVTVMKTALSDLASSQSMKQ